MGGTNAGSVTVVMPTYNRRRFLDELLPALRAQEGVDFDVVIVDDGSSDGTVEHLAEAVGDDERFTVLSTGNRGPASARNSGAALAEGRWIAFTDDDCIAEEGWLAALVEEAERSGADVVQGRTTPVDGPPRSEQAWFIRSLNVNAWTGRFETCNLLVRASSFHAVGGFDETFPLPVGEDTDLGLRLVRGGATTAFAGGAHVRHRVFAMTYVEFLKRRWFWGNVVHLVAVNPDGRSIFPHPYVAYRTHAAFWAAVPVVAWAAATRRWSVPAVGMLGYALLRGRRSRFKGRSWPVSIAIGASELGGVASGALGFAHQSVRKRRLLL